ncbi:MAG: aminopeptidase [Clostridiales bacterium]|nr:aminopeptidase [Clostridiales bacterium]
MKEINEQIIERYMLSIERIRRITEEETTEVLYRDYFRKVSEFILKINEIRERMQDKPFEQCTLDELKRENESIYADVVGDQYDTSYANPAYAVSLFGEEIGQLLSFLYTELRGEIAYVYEQQVEYLAICNELFIEIYNCFEGTLTPDYKELKEIVYWYASDYCDVFVADRIEEQLNPECSFAADIVTKSNLNDLRYLYQYGEYVSENEWKTAEHLNALPQKTIDQMADVYTEGYRIGFVNAGIDLSKKSVVNIRYTLGFERVIKKAIENFEKMGLRPTIYRAAVSVLTKRQHYKVGYYGAIANKQYEYDHRLDQGLFLDKKFLERKLDVMKNAYEKYKELAGEHAGPAVMEIFGEEPFAPVQKPESVVLTEKQEKLSVLFDSKSGQLTNQYIKGDERSFTIVAYPVPEIGAQYKEIFDEVIRINTLDANVYKNVQQALIDALDKGEYVHILGKDKNETNLKVQLYRLSDPAKETIFENCVADVNIPVGEVFTSPVLEGTNGVLNVSKVYLNELQYRDLKITFEDGKITEYTCSNFEDEEQSKKYIKSNILHNHDTLPLGEFAIGTNTTAYVVAKKYQIEDKMPILIAEKMGPHFAVGDTCYSWSEENKLYNPDGKEIVAKDNSVSILRKEDVSKAYFQCHTDITIPYEELEEIAVVTEKGERIVLLKDGHFVLSGTEILNEPLKEAGV